MRREKGYPKNHADGKQKARMAEGVYAGPDFFAMQPPQMFQTVYGGPEYFTQQNPSPVPGPAVDPNAQTADMTPRMHCASCGAQIAADAKFCPECGTPAQADAQPRTYCVECGAQLAAGAKFCRECGSLQPKSDA